MEKCDLTNILEDYDKRYKLYGYNPKTLGWDKSRHKLRYYILLSHWNLSKRAVLDFGCGFGDMYGYAKEHGIDFNYFGIDINKNLINEGKKIYPFANLEVRNLFLEKPDRMYDYTFSSGVHNFRLNDNISFIKDSFELFNNISTLGFTVNFISNKVDFTRNDLYYSDPAFVLELAYKYSNRIVLRNDYMPFEYTIFVDKQKEFDKDLVVYSDFIKYV